MAKRDKVMEALNRTYEQLKEKEQEELHNAIVHVMQEHKTSIANTLFVLDFIRFELMEAKYKEIMGVVKLTDKPPVSEIKPVPTEPTK